MRIAHVYVDIEPYPIVARTKMRVKVAGPSQVVGGGVWIAGREVMVESVNDGNLDERAQLEQTLARALDELAALS